MKSIRLYLAAISTSVSASYCVADHCAVAVAGNYDQREGHPSHRADCSSFLRYTSEPPPETRTITKPQQTITITVTKSAPQITTTITSSLSLVIETITFIPSPEIDTTYVTPIQIVTTTETPSADITTEDTTITVSTDVTSTTTSTVYYSNAEKRGLPTLNPLKCPTKIPSYAGACSGAAGYSSACSCWGVSKSTVRAPCSTTTKTIQLPAMTKIKTVSKENATPTVTKVITLSASTITTTETEPSSTTTQTLTADATTLTITVTGAQGYTTEIDTSTATVTDVETETVTRSVGPICQTQSPVGGCGCTAEVICDTQVILDLATFRSHLDFNTYVNSFEECIERCNNNPACRFGQFAALPSGGLCSSYVGDPGLAGTSSASDISYFELAYCSPDGCSG